MNRRNMMKGMSALMVMTSFAMIASVVAAQEGDTATAAAHWDAQKLGAGLALGLCGIGTGTVSYTHLTLPTIYSV